MILEAEWLAPSCEHIPDRNAHLVRYLAWYSNSVRGERAIEASLRAGAARPARSEQLSTEFAARAKVTWARLIRKIDVADPLECPNYKGPMHVIALIKHPEIVRRVIEHLALWAPHAMEQRPPPSPETLPVHASLPLIVHPVPDVA